jgi:hypothetical protein
MPATTLSLEQNQSQHHPFFKAIKDAFATQGNDSHSWNVIQKERTTILQLRVKNNIEPCHQSSQLETKSLFCQ